VVEWIGKRFIFCNATRNAACKCKKGFPYQLRKDQGKKKEKANCGVVVP
jgi:hypothetical protein